MTVNGLYGLNMPIEYHYMIRLSMCKALFGSLVPVFGLCERFIGLFCIPVHITRKLLKTQIRALCRKCAAWSRTGHRPPGSKK